MNPLFERLQAESVQAWKDEKADDEKWIPYRKAKRPERHGRVCPKCRMEMPVVGDCENCG